MSVTYRTKLLLAFRSGGICAFQQCGRFLTADGTDPVVTGEAAHIAGERLGAARFNSDMTDEQRDHYHNLIYMCGDHHTQIDKQETEFPVQRLHDLKREHEAIVRRAITDAFAGVGFAELELATQWVMTVHSQQQTQDFTLIPPEDKLKRNELGPPSRTIITMGLSVAHDVQAFVETATQVDPDFPDRLKTGFLAEYYRLRHDGHRGDDLFDLMCHFAQRGVNRQAQRSAGIAVLVYLFEACEVFEK